MANDCTPIWEPGGSLTCHAAAALTGKRFCVISADAQGKLVTGLDVDASGGNPVVNYPSAGGGVLGVLNRDVASGGDVGVWSTPGMIVPIKSAAGITYGQEVKVDSSGRVLPVTAGAVAVGVCMATVINGDDAPIKIYGAVGSGGAGGLDIIGQARPGQLVDNSGGAAADGTIGAVDSTPHAADAVKELATKVNAIEAALVAAGIFA